ncbi:MAG: GNAT family N-acetyltransferase [Frankiaceae bacterium]
MRIVDLDPADATCTAQMLAVVRELRPHLSTDSFAAVLAEGAPQGLRFTGVFDAAREPGPCLAVAGWRIIATTSALRKLYVDDLVTASHARSSGVGRLLLQELRERAGAAGCTVLDLDSGVTRFDAHRFYLRERMRIQAHHFALSLPAGTPAGTEVG